MATITINLTATLEEVETIRDALETAWLEALDKTHKAVMSGDKDNMADFYRDKANKLNEIRQHWK